MSVLGDTAKPVRPDRAQIDAWVDILDRAEPDRTGWQSAFTNLKEALTGAREMRRIVRLPATVLCALLAIAWFAILFSATDALDERRLWLNGAVSVLALVVLAWEFAMRRVFPVLQLEGRVAALLRYYGGKDVSPEEEVY
jgi:hypothetical protein